MDAGNGSEYQTATMDMEVLTFQEFDRRAHIERHGKFTKAQYRTVFSFCTGATTDAV
jgi:hypothetical protein